MVLLYVAQARNGKQRAPLGTNWDEHALIAYNGKDPRTKGFQGVGGPLGTPSHQILPWRQ
jgi:hypothetical protein